MSGSEKKTTSISFMAVIAVSLSTMIAMLDSTIANVALPVIASDFKVTPSESILIVNAYQFAVVAFLLPLAALGKTVGNKRIFEAGVLFFALSSLGCASSESLGELTLFRIIQGAGAAAILSVNAALIKEIYPARLLGRGLSINVMIVSVSAAAGPSIAAAILSVTSWNWLFTINGPIAVVSLLLSIFFLKKRPLPEVHFDMAGALLMFAVAMSFSLCIFGLTRDLPLMATISFDALILLLIGLYQNQKSKTDAALIPVRFFRNRTLSLSLIMSTLSYSTQLLAYVSLPFYFHETLKRSVVQTGLLLTAWPLATTITAMIAGELVKKINCHLLAVAGLSILMVGMLLLIFLPSAPGDADIIWRVAICGMGFGFFQSPNNYHIMASVSSGDASVASGLLGSARVIGQITGSAMVAILFNLDNKYAIEYALIAGATFSFLSCCVSCLRYRSEQSSNS
ncbi:MFS transporter [Pantoea sp. ME81]|uniref:MFS transporter n=1 Tax=Pantoea sp. ME81 TaxID=2743935 RepID=UPI0015F3F31E|nr:MFS transporter [Pantoea sp. ME81]